MNENTGVLLIHGFAGNVEEVSPLRDYLRQKGYPVACPLLTGHGNSKKDLSRTTHEDWIASAERSYLQLARTCSRVIVVGFSMGGLIAVNLWHYGYSGLVTVNMPVYYWNPKIIVANLFRDFRKFGKKYLTASTDKSIASMVEFLKLLSKTKPMLGNITCKTLVIQAMDDDTVHCRSADYIYDRIRGGKNLQKLPRGGHMIFQSGSSDEACAMIDEFIRDHVC
jgi:carboxylesterase